MIYEHNLFCLSLNEVNCCLIITLVVHMHCSVARVLKDNNLLGNAYSYGSYYRYWLYVCIAMNKCLKTQSLLTSSSQWMACFAPPLLLYNSTHTQHIRCRRKNQDLHSTDSRTATHSLLLWQCVASLSPSLYLLPPISLCSLRFLSPTIFSYNT